MNENFATKSDLKETELRLESKILAVESRLESKIQAAETRLDSGLKELEYKLTIKLGTMMTIAIGVFATLVRILPASGH